MVATTGALVPLVAVNVPLLVQLPPTLSALVGAVTVPAVIVKSLPTSASFEKLHAPPLPLKVNLLNLLAPVNVPAIVFPVAVELKVTVAVPALKVPLLLQLPPTVISKVAVAGSSVPPEAIVTFPERDNAFVLNLAVGELVLLTERFEMLTLLLIRNT